MSKTENVCGAQRAGLCSLEEDDVSLINPWIDSLTHLLNKYFSSTYHMSSTVLGAGDTRVMADTLGRRTGGCLGQAQFSSLGTWMDGGIIH